MDFYNISEEKLFAEYKVQKHYKEIERLNIISLQFITEMLLCNKIKIQWLPFELRISNIDFYISAFRVSRNTSKERFMDDIMLLYDDTKKNFSNNEKFMEMLLLSLERYEFKGEEQFETIKANITKEILLKLSVNRELSKNHK